MMPDAAPAPVQHDNIPKIDPISNPLVDNRKIPHEGPITDPYMREPTEATEVRVIRAPHAPTPEQIEKHNASMHLPYRSWCPICVWGRGKEKAHVKQDGPHSDMPFFSCDYCFLTSKDSPADNPNSNEKLTVLSLKSISQQVMTVVPQKGVDPTGLAVQYYLQCIGELGYANVPICVKNDQEPAIKCVTDAMINARAAQTIKEESPVGSSQSNGTIENAVGESEAQIRTGRLALEHNFMHRIPINHPIVPWLVKHCSFALNRFLIGHDGKSAYERVRGRPFKSEIIELGETVYYKKPKNTIGPGLNKWDSRWGIGVFLGVRTVSGELFVGTSDGVFLSKNCQKGPT